MLTSCDTPVGQGAAWGAATGAIIGGAATGNVRAASIGDQGFFIALIQVASTISAVYRPVDLLATLIRVAFSASHSRHAALRPIECF